MVTSKQPGKINTGAHPASAACLGFLTVLAAAVLAAAPGAAQPGTGTIRVATTGTDSGSCGSAAAPCRTIPQAVGLAASGDEIRVAAGTYTAHATCCCNAGDAVICMANKELTIGGGYTSADWNTSDPEANPTILDGEGVRRVAFVTRTASATSLTLEGVTVTRGFATGAAGADARGGAIQAFWSALNLTDVEVRDSRSVGGPALAGGKGGAGTGGGVALSSLSGQPITSTFTDVHFEGNSAEGGAASGSGEDTGGYGQGGGLFVLRTDLVATGLTFVDNLAVGGDAPSGRGCEFISAGNPCARRADAQGGGVCVQVQGTVDLTGVTATGNQAIGGDANMTDGFGGQAFGGFFFAEGSGDATLREVDVRDNDALGGEAHAGGLGGGGGLATTQTTLTVEDSVLIDNLAKGGDAVDRSGAAGGGAAYLLFDTNLTLTNVIMADNTAAAGASTMANIAAGGGGALFVENSDGSVIHGTMARNSLGHAAMEGEAAVLLNGSTVDFDYTIFAEHTSVGAAALHSQQAGDTANLRRGIFSANSADKGGTGTISEVVAMLSFADVEFASPGAPNFDYHLRSTSPARDEATTSTSTTDVDGEARTDPDIGADEFGDAPIFTDGFESGNTSRWSAAVP